MPTVGRPILWAFFVVALPPTKAATWAVRPCASADLDRLCRLPLRVRRPTVAPDEAFGTDVPEVYLIGQYADDRL